MVNWFIIGFYLIGLIVALFFILHMVAYRNKAYYVQVDTDQDKKIIVPFADGIKRYKVENIDGKSKARVPGFKNLIPFTKNNLNPSHKKNWGGIIVEHGDNIFFAELKIMADKDNTLWMRVIPYDQRVNYAESVKMLNRRFSPDKWLIIASGIVVVAMIVSFLMV